MVDSRDGVFEVSTMASAEGGGSGDGNLGIGGIGDEGLGVVAGAGGVAAIRCMAS